MTEQDIPAEAKKRLEHHIGKWTATTEYVDQEGKVFHTAVAHDEAKYTIEGRVVELTSYVPEQNHTSKAWFFYSIPEATWYLTSVDNHGDLWVLSGGLDDYIITSRPKPHPEGGTIIIRFTHLNIEADSFDAIMESSRDEGKTWTKVFNQRVERVVE